MDKTAVVILNWNGVEMLKQFLPTVVRHTEAGETIYVADNGSTDSSVAWIEATLPTVNLIRLDRNYGFAGGYNRALSQIKEPPEYFVLLNSDVEVTPGWLRPMTDYLDSHPQVAACQPKLRSWHQKDQFEYAGAAGGFIDKYGYPFCRGRILGTVETDCGQYDDIVPLFWASGAAFMIRSQEFTQTGGFNTRFFAHMEEIELCWRLRERGKQIVCIPQSTVYHIGAATLKKENPKKTFLNFRNSLLTLYLHLPAEELRKVMRTRLWLDYIAALSFVLKGQIANAKAVIKARTEYKKRRTEFAEERKKNLQEAGTQQIAERYPGSILYQYYIKQNKHYGKIDQKDRTRGT